MSALLRGSSCCAAAILGLACATAALAEPSNKWRIEVDNEADSTGQIVFQVLPVGGTPLRVSVDVPEGMGENDVADVISAAFKSQLPANGYRVEVDDGEDVLVKKADEAADFDLALLSSTVAGVEIDLERE